ncbi:MAG: hypothetical protein RLZZ385_997 [Pseudomonadota bacterium]|jgi:CBS domain containing-hemolysin-like protein
MSDLTIMVPLLAALLLIKGFFSGSEIALVSCDKLKLKSRAERGDKSAALVLKLFDKPETMLATTLIGTNIASMTLTVLGTAMMLELVGNGGDIYTVLILTPLMLILGEIVPKSVYQQHADTLAPRLAPLLAVIRLLLQPVSLVFGWLARRIADAVAPKAEGISPFLTRQRLRLMLESADRAAELPVLDRNRIQRALRLADMTVGEAMVPLVEVVGAPYNVTLRKLSMLGRKSGHRRIPLYRDNISNIVGIASWTIWDEMTPGFTKHKLKEFVLQPYYASAIQRLDDLLPVLLSRSDRMVVVVDEFGTATGIVTIEDVMEILLGEAARGLHLGAHGWELPRQPEHLEGNVLLLDARSRLVEVAELLDVDLPSREFHSLGGLLTGRLRRIPRQDDSLEEFGYRFTVVEATQRAPIRVRVEPLA